MTWRRGQNRNPMGGAHHETSWTEEHISWFDARNGSEGKWNHQYLSSSLSPIQGQGSLMAVVVTGPKEQARLEFHSECKCEVYGWQLLPEVVRCQWRLEWTACAAKRAASLTERSKRAVRFERG